MPSLYQKLPCCWYKEGQRLGYGWVVVLKKTVHYFINSKNNPKQIKKRTEIKRSFHTVELSIRESIVVQL
jgi:hypothetical protein